jgi:hypothetical protein
MQKLTEEQWAKLPFPDYRARFFVESWWSLLGMKTPHFYQARLMNSYSLLKEISELIIDYTKESKNLNQLRTSCEEALDVISADADFNKFHQSVCTLLCEMLKSIKKDKDVLPTDDKIRKLFQLVNSLMDTEQEFVTKLIDELNLTLTDEIDQSAESGKERKLNHIYSLTDKVVSCLLSAGYSPTYLFNRAELLTYPVRYKGRIYVEQLKVLFDRLKLADATYTVIQPVIISKRFLLPEMIGDVVLLKESPIKLDENEQLKLGISKLDKTDVEDHTVPEIVYLKKELTAKDYVSAAWKMKQCIETVRDITSFEFKENIFNLILPKCLVEFRDPIVHKHIVRIELLNTLLITRSDAYQSSSMIEVLNKTMELESESLGITGSINRIIRYHRLGIEEVTLESRFLSIWIVLEAIVGGGEGNIIDNIIQVVPELYAFDSLRKRIQYLVELFRNHKVTIPEEILQKEGYDNYPVENLEKLKLIYKVISNKDYALKIFNNLGNDEFIKYKLLKLHKEFEDKKSVLNRIEKTKNDVSMQIRRIYYLRNKIVHQAHHGSVSVRLFSHLYDYVDYIMCDILMELVQTTRPIESLREISDGYLMSMERKKIEWKEAASLDFDDVYYLSAIV